MEPIPVEVRYTGIHTSDGRDGRHTPCLRGFFGGEVPGEVVLNAGVGGYGIRYPLSIWFSPTAVERRVEENRAAPHVVGANGQLCPWYGVIVMLKYGGRRCTTFIDITRRDLMVLSAFTSHAGMHRGHGRSM